MKDPQFLRSILPISAELDRILKRVFEIDPSKRISIAELKNEIFQCQAFTRSSAPVTPARLPSPVSIEDFSQDVAYYQPKVHVPAIVPALQPVFQQSPPLSPIHDWHMVNYQYPSTASAGSGASDTNSVFSASSSNSSHSSASSYSHVQAGPKVQVPSPVAPQYAQPPAPTWFSLKGLNPVLSNLTSSFVDRRPPFCSVIAY